jgi:hypothetical protein
MTMKPLNALSRSLGAVVCSVRGHRYFYPNSAIASWCAYSCIRCRKLDRSLEDLPYAPDDAEDLIGYEDEEQIEADRRHESRWFEALRFPRWL